MKIVNPSLVPFRHDHLGPRSIRHERENLMREKPNRITRLLTGSFTLVVFGVLAVIATIRSVLTHNTTSLSNLFPFTTPGGVVKTFTTDPRAKLAFACPFLPQLG